MTTEKKPYLTEFCPKYLALQVKNKNPEQNGIFVERHDRKKVHD
jgi:hypothetical protein